MDIKHLPVPNIISFYIVRIEMLHAGRQLGVELLIFSHMKVVDALFMAELPGMRAQVNQRLVDLAKGIACRETHQKLKIPGSQHILPEESGFFQNTPPDSDVGDVASNVAIVKHDF